MKLDELVWNTPPGLEGTWQKALVGPRIYVYRSSERHPDGPGNYIVGISPITPFGANSGEREWGSGHGGTRFLDACTAQAIIYYCLNNLGGNNERAA